MYVHVLHSTKRPPTKSQSLPHWHFYVFALCRQVDGLSANDWQLGVVRRPFPSHAADSSWLFVVPIRERPSVKNRNSCLFGCQVDNGRSSFWRVHCTCQPLDLHVSFYGHPNRRVREGPIPSLTLVSKVWPNPDKNYSKHQRSSKALIMWVFTS